MSELSALVEQASRLCQSRQCEEAIWVLEEAAHLDPTNPMLHYELGFCYSGGCCQHSLSDPDIALLHHSSGVQPNIGFRRSAAQGKNPRCHGEHTPFRIEIFSASPASLYRELGLPEDWAREQFNQANVWCDLPEEGHSEKWTQAILLYEGALQVRTKEKARELYAGTMQNLGTAYRELRSDDRGRNVRKAIRCYHEALRVRWATSSRLKAALLHHNFGNAFLTLAEVEKSQDKRHAGRALRHFNRALQFYSRNDHPCDYAKTQLSRGQAYVLLAQQGPEEHLHSAEFCFSEARECLAFCEDSELFKTRQAA
jgi:tetratricopeptide (TPR) repeat protein